MQTSIKFKYNTDEIKALLLSMTVLIDSRERENSHIIQYLDKSKVAHKKVTLNVGDYSILLPKNIELGIVRDMYFSDNFIIERKASLDELSNNFCKQREQFKNEFYRGAGAKLILLIEDASLNDMIAHNYRSQLKEKAFISSLFSFQCRFDLNVNFIDKANSGLFIHMSCYYWLAEFLKA
jgi:ERCC4-type nuclease